MKTQNLILLNKLRNVSSSKNVFYFFKCDNSYVSIYNCSAKIIIVIMNDKTILIIIVLQRYNKTPSIYCKLKWI